MNSTNFSHEIQQLLVSAPLRGRGHEIIEGSFFVFTHPQFPSPCGEEVMKCRDLILVPADYYQFPSPCGEEVMKFKRSCKSYRGKLCFRPLAGKRS